MAVKFDVVNQGAGDAFLRMCRASAASGNEIGIDGLPSVVSPGPRPLHGPPMVKYAAGVSVERRGEAK